MKTQKVGPFDLEEKLGVGGMGIVYRARYRKNDRIVALKLLTPQFTENPRLVARFEREMKILEKLDHPNITRYYGGGVVKGQHFYAMRLMRGGTLSQLLKKKTQLPWEQVVEFGCQICDALDHAHENGIIHRDLKPANLFLRLDKKTGEERLVLGDFGIARDLDADGLTATGMTVGTYAYMAPEQITGKGTISAKTDLYALGCVLFQMLSGRTPYKAESQGEVLVMHLKEDTPPVREFAPDTPVWLDDVIRQLLAKESRDRPIDAAYTKMALEEVTQKVANQESVATHVASGAPTAMTMFELNPDLKNTLRKATKRKKKKRREAGPVYERTWFLVLCLAGILGGVTWFVWPASEQQLWTSAEPLMASGDMVQERDAVERFLKPMLKRFPEGEHAEEARSFIRTVAVNRLKRRLINNARLNREPKSEAERLFRRAWNFEQFGDRISALEIYESMHVLLKEREGLEDFAELASLQIADIRGGDTMLDRLELIRAKLRIAETHVEAGERLKAEELWRGIIRLYAENSELTEVVTFARGRINGTAIGELTFTLEEPAPGEI